MSASFNPSALARNLVLVAGHDFRDVVTITREVDPTYNPGGHTLAFAVTARDADAELLTPTPQLTVLASAVSQGAGGRWLLTLTAMLHLPAAQVDTLTPGVVYDYRVRLIDSAGEPYPALWGWLLVEQVG